VKGETLFGDLVLKQHRLNFELWHQEDEARRKDVSDAIIANVKRAIDRLNQIRNDFIEKLDLYLVEEVNRREITVKRGAVMNSETPGSIVDRLSILNLRIFHMQEEMNREDAGIKHRQRCKQKFEVLLEQRKDLIDCLEQLIQDIFIGKKKIKLYRQFKMYNDPSLNPSLYTGKKRSSRFKN
jgi:hypothetical protein